MKKLDLHEMENIQGGQPCGATVSCYVVSTVMTFLNPVAGILAGAACLWMPCY